MATSCEFVNLQRYSDGESYLPEDYLEAIPGLDPAKLTIGLEIENPVKNGVTNNTIEKIQKVPWMEIKDGKKVAGVWTWRLGSNWEFENLFQVWLYNLVHQKSLTAVWNGADVVPDTGLVKQEWKKNGGKFES